MASLLIGQRHRTPDLRLDRLPGPRTLISRDERGQTSFDARSDGTPQPLVCGV